MSEQSQIIKTIKRVMPAVVSVVISKKLKDVEKEMRSDSPPGIPIDIPSDKIDAHGMVQVGSGSGFIVDAKGIVLTNKHVISESHAEYSVITEDNQRYKAKVLACDPIDDVAILSIESDQNFPVIELGDSKNLELGQTVLAIGNALGNFKNTVSQGIISGLSRAIPAKASPKAPVQEMRGLIQTDAAINPGNSGGPLVDINGKAIGVNTAVVYGAQNIGFAIPIKAAERDLKDLEKYGRIRRPLLGIRYLILNQDIQEKLKLPVDYGVLVVKEGPLDHAVAPKSPADKAGILEKDIILKWEDQKITPEKTVQDFLEDCQVGQTVAFTILRNKKEIETKVVLTERK